VSCCGPFDLDLTGEDEREGEAHSEARVPVNSGDVRAEVDLRRGSGGVPRRRSRRRRSPRREELDGDHGGLDLFQGRKQRTAGDARGDDVLRESSGELDWLQNKARKGVRGMRRFEAKRVEVRGGARAHRRWRILPGMLAEVWTSDERLCPFGGVSRRRRKGRWRRSARVSYSCGYASINAGNEGDLRGEGSYCGGNGHRHDFRREEEDDLALTGGARCQRVRERDRVPVRELAGWAVAGSSDGPKSFPAAFSYFLFFFLFSFSVFLFLL
jgi:hypothetical protein